MKLSPTERKERASATLAPTLLLVCGCFALLAVAAYAAQPSWWSSRGVVLGPQVTTNNGVVTTNYAPNDYAVVTQGQLKQFTARAVDELNADLAGNGGAGTNLNNMVSNWVADYATNGYNATNIEPSDYTVMNVGQLKYIASLVYGQLGAAGYTGLTPPWIVRNTSTDNVAANLGQLKEVFNFDLSIAPAALTNLSATANFGEIDLSWSLPGMNTATSITILQSTDGGTTWTTVATLGATATSYAATGLDPGGSYTYQINPNNPAGSSTNSPPNPVTPLAPPSPRYAVIDFGTNFTPAGINDSGVVVGNGSTGPAYWSPSVGAVTNLQANPTFAGYPSAPDVSQLMGVSVVGINNNNQMIGNVTAVDDGVGNDDALFHSVFTFGDTNPAQDFSWGNLACYWANLGAQPQILGQQVETWDAPWYGTFAVAISNAGFIVGNNNQGNSVWLGLSFNPNWNYPAGPDLTYWYTGPGSPTYTGPTTNITFNTAQVLSGGIGGTYIKPTSAAGASYWCGTFDWNFQYPTGHLYGPVINGTPYFDYFNQTLVPNAINEANIVAAQQGWEAYLVKQETDTSLTRTDLGPGNAWALNNLVDTNNTPTPQVVGADRSANPTLWDQTMYDGTPTTNGVYVAKNLNKITYGATSTDGTNTPPWNLHAMNGINTNGAIIGTAIYTPQGTNDTNPAGPHGVMLLPIAITPSVIPTSGVGRAKLVFGSGVQVPTIDPTSSQIAITIGGQNVTDIHQDDKDPHIFYFTVPPGTAGSADVTISGISVPGMPWLSATPPQTMTLPGFVQYTSDVVKGTQGFSDANVVAIDEDKSTIDYLIQQGTITSAQAFDTFSEMRDTDAQTAEPDMEEFFSSNTPDVGALNNLTQQATNELNVVYATYPPPSGSGGPSSGGVAILASTPDAYENGPTLGMFTVSCPTTSTSAVTVNYTITGTAVNGTDYTTLSGSVIIPAGQTSAQIVVAPIQHALGGNKTVVLTLSSGTGYTINSSYNAATVTIYDYGNTVTSNTSLKKNTRLVARNGATHPVVDQLFMSHFFIGSGTHQAVNPSALVALMIGQIPPPPLPPQLGSPTFFTDVQNRLAATGSTMYCGTAYVPWGSGTSGVTLESFFVFSADKYHMTVYPASAVGTIIDNAVAANPSASLIINGAQCNYHCPNLFKRIVENAPTSNPEPFQTIGVVIHGGSVLSPTSSTSSKKSWATALARYWFGQSTAANSGQALSYQFGQGNPTASATPEALGGLTGFIYPTDVPLTPGPNAKDLIVYSPMRLGGDLPGFNIIGVNRATGMIIVVSKDHVVKGSLFAVQALLHASGVDLAEVTDGGGSVGCWSKTTGYVAKGERQKGTPDNHNTVTTYIVFTPN